MTDKQIIIDGVDVSGCYELFNGCCCDNGSFYCKDQPNCQFKLEKRGYKIEQITEFTPREELLETITHLRVLNAEIESYNEQLKESQNIEIKENKILREQLKAKEQECETLASQLDFEVQKKECLEQECKRLKEEMGTRCESCKALHIIADDYNDCITENKQLKAENEELKKWKETAKDLFDKTCSCKYLNKENAHCSLYNKECVAINQCLYKNQQTLTEIKEIAENVIKNVSNRCIETTPMYSVHKQILQKISEVEDE